MDGRPISVDLILGVAQGYMQWKALGDAQSAWSTYNDAVQANAALDAQFQTDTAAFQESMDDTYNQLRLASLIGIASQLMDM